MARKSVIQREYKREQTVQRYAVKRQALKATIQNPQTSDEDRWQAQVQLQKLPRDSSPSRLTHRCHLTGRPKGVYRKYHLSRHKLRSLSMLGYIPGLKKASW